MAEYDLDLQSIQEARALAVAARDAQRQFAHASQAEVDRVCAAMAEAAHAAAVRLGRMAVEETGYGVPEHKTLKNVLCSKLLWDAIKDIPTVGVIRHGRRFRMLFAPDPPSWGQRSVPITGAAVWLSPPEVLR